MNCPECGGWNTNGSEPEYRHEGDDDVYEVCLDCGATYNVTAFIERDEADEAAASRRPQEKGDDFPFYCPDCGGGQEQDYGPGGYCTKCGAGKIPNRRPPKL